MKNKNMRLTLANSRELKLFFVLCFFLSANLLLSNSANADMFYDTQVAQEPKKRDYSEFYKIKNYIKGVHYSAYGHPDKNHPRIKNSEEYGLTRYFRVQTVYLPDGSNPWSRIVAHQLNKRGFSKKQIKHYSYLRSQMSDIHSIEPYKERRQRLKKCYPSNLRNFVNRKGKRVLNYNCGMEGYLPTEYNVETGKFLGLDPYKFAKNLPQCFAKDETICNIKYPSFKILGYYGRGNMMPCKLTPGQIKYCRKHEFKDKTRYKGYYQCKKIDKDGNVSYFDDYEGCPYIKKVNYKRNLAFGCHLIAPYARQGECGPMGSFEPPGVAMKSKVIFKPPPKSSTKKRYLIAPGHYCPPPDDLWACMPSSDSDRKKVRYVVE